MRYIFIPSANDVGTSEQIQCSFQVTYMSLEGRTVSGVDVGSRCRSNLHLQVVTRADTGGGARAASHSWSSTTSGLYGIRPAPRSGMCGTEGIVLDTVWPSAHRQWVRGHETV